MGFSKALRKIIDKVTGKDKVKKQFHQNWNDSCQLASKGGK